MQQGAEAARRKRLKTAGVVGATCCASLVAEALQGVHFDIVLLDEASQVVEPLALAPIIRSKCRCDAQLPGAKPQTNDVMSQLAGMACWRSCRSSAPSAGALLSADYPAFRVQHKYGGAAGACAHHPLKCRCVQKAAKLLKPLKAEVVEPLALTPSSSRSASALSTTCFWSGLDLILGGSLAAEARPHQPLQVPVRFRTYSWSGLGFTFRWWSRSCRLSAPSAGAENAAVQASNG